MADTIDIARLRALAEELQQEKFSTILVSWPMRELDDDGFPSGDITSRHTLTTAMNGGHWLEPDVLNASGEWFGDEDSFAEAPDLWQPLPTAPAAAQKGEA